MYGKVKKNPLYLTQHSFYAREETDLTIKYISERIEKAQLENGNCILEMPHEVEVPDVDQEEEQTRGGLNADLNHFKTFFYRE